MTPLQRQGIVPEDEWESFMSTLREPLPASFRVTGTRSQSQALLAIVQEDFLKVPETPARLPSDRPLRMVPLSLGTEN